MEKVIFEVEIITPMFLAGNEQKKVKVPGRDQPFKDEPPADTDDYSWQKVAELRGSSIRGLMRYWQRAIVGSLATTNTERMRLVKQAEKEVFGSTDQGSAIQIRIQPLVINIKKDIAEYDKQNGKKLPTDKGYLLFSLVDTGNRPANDIIDKKNRAYPANASAEQAKRQGEEISAYQPPRQYIAEGSTFRVIFSVHSNVPNGKEVLKKAIAAFWLLTNLGGIGSRSRRCAGSIRVTNVINNLAGLSFDEPKDVQQLEKQLREGIKSIQKLWKTQFSQTSFASKGTSVEIASFDILDMIAEPKSCYFWILSNNKDGWSSIDDAMNDIGWSLKNYRQVYRPKLTLENRAIFGLPIVVLNRHQRQDPYSKGLYKYLIDARMASPLLLKISKLQNDKYICLAVLFQTEGKYVKDTSKKGKYNNSIDDYKLIKKFIQDMLAHWR